MCSQSLTTTHFQSFMIANPLATLTLFSAVLTFFQDSGRFPWRPNLEKLLPSRHLATMNGFTFTWVWVMPHLYSRGWSIPSFQISVGMTCSTILVTSSSSPETLIVIFPSLTILGFHRASNHRPNRNGHQFIV